MGKRGKQKVKGGERKCDTEKGEKKAKEDMEKEKHQEEGLFI